MASSAVLVKPVLEAVEAATQYSNISSFTTSGFPSLNDDTRLPGGGVGIGGIGPEATGNITQTSANDFQAFLVGAAGGALSLVTITGNLMVMVSFKLDKQLQTISNYFLFSLAVADMIIGVVSMPLYTFYTISNKWTFGAVACDLYLSVDYMASNASVLNLLVISFDRYLSVTRPLTYRARRTTRRAALMIFLSWAVAAVVWPPWIISWPYIEGVRTVPHDDCYIQFIYSNGYMSIITVIQAFFAPVSVMIGLYLRVWWETVKRQRELVHLQAAGKKVPNSSKRSDSSDETGDDLASATSYSCPATTLGGSGHGGRGNAGQGHQGLHQVGKNSSLAARWRFGRGRRSSSRHSVSTVGEHQEITYVPTSALKAAAAEAAAAAAATNCQKQELSAWDRISTLCLSCVSPDGGDYPSSEFAPGESAATTVVRKSGDTGGGMAVPSSNLIKDPYASSSKRHRRTSGVDQTVDDSVAGVETPLIESDNSIYTILIRLPPPSTAATESTGASSSNNSRRSRSASKSSRQAVSCSNGSKLSSRSFEGNLSEVAASAGDCGRIQLLPAAAEDKYRSLPPTMVRSVSGPPAASQHHHHRGGGGGGSGHSYATTTSSSLRSNHSGVNHNNISASAVHGVKRPHGVASATTSTSGGGRKGQPQPSSMASALAATSAAISVSAINKKGSNASAAGAKGKKSTSEKKQERKAAKTLSAILLAFIITWTPYSVLTVVNAILGKELAEQLIPQVVWNLSYYLCYINSTVNPVLYALCNAAFRRTYVRILTCRWTSRVRAPVSRYYYG